MESDGEITALANLIVVEHIQNVHDEILLARAKKVKPEAILGDVIEVEVTPEGFGRIAAQTARQAILQRMVEHDNLDMTEIRAVIIDIIQDDTRAAAVIQHMRSLLKPGEFHSQVLDLNDVVRETLELVHNEMITRRVAVSCAKDDARLPVTGDPIQLQQLLLNLIFNAADAMAGDKGGMVLITTDQIEGPCAHLAVTDTGQGIEPDVLGRLFEPFISTKTQGVGLGLPISRR